MRSIAIKISGLSPILEDLPGGYMRSCNLVTSMPRTSGREL